MMKLLKSTFAIVLLSTMFLSNNLLANKNVISDNTSLTSKVDQAEGNQYQEAGIFPFFGENSFFPLEISKSHLLLITIILSVTLFVFAHKNNFETDIYAFYHTKRDGSISFESLEAQRTFEFRSFLAKTFRISGIVTAFASIIMILI